MGWARRWLESPTCVQSIPLEPDQQTSHLARITELVNHSLTQTRELAKGFYPVELERHGLQLALQELAMNVRHTFNINCRVACDKSMNRLDKAVQIQLFRIIQESIRNAVRHTAKPRTMSHPNRAC